MGLYRSPATVALAASRINIDPRDGIHLTFTYPCAKKELTFTAVLLYESMMAVRMVSLGRIKAVLIAYDRTSGER